MSGFPHQVYWIYSDLEELLYVGMTGGIQGRLAAHRQSSEWWHLVGHVEVETHPTREGALVREYWAIKDERPRFNKCVKRPKFSEMPKIIFRDGIDISYRRPARIW